VPIGTVPIYQWPREGRRRSGPKLNIDVFLETLIEQSRAGRRLLHDPLGRCALGVQSRIRQNRMTGIVSRGRLDSSRKWCLAPPQRELPLQPSFERICEVMKKYDVAFLARRRAAPGARSRTPTIIARQFAELETLGEADRHRVEARHPGDDRRSGPTCRCTRSKRNVDRQMEVCKEAPFYTLGPLATDIAPGYDHITSANRRGDDRIGSARRMLCYVTPKEHLGLPDRDDVKAGRDRVQDSRLTRADLAKGPSRAHSAATTPSARHGSSSGGAISFHLSLDPDYRQAVFTTRRYRRTAPSFSHFCSMCGPKFCSMKITGEVREPRGQAGDRGRGWLPKPRSSTRVAARIYVRRPVEA